MLLSKFFKSLSDAEKPTKEEEYVNGDNDVKDAFTEEDTDAEECLDPDLEIELERLQLEKLKLKEAEIQCKQRMLLLNSVGKKPTTTLKSIGNRCVLPNGRVVVRNTSDRVPDQPDSTFNSAAGDSRALYSCSCDQRALNEPGTSGSSTASTCVLCSEEKGVTNMDKDKSPLKYDTSPNKYITSVSTVTRSVDLSKTEKKSEYSRCSKTTEVTKSIISRSDYSKISETVTKQSDVTSKKVAKLARRSDLTCDFKYSDFYSDSDDEADETNRLIQLRNVDYMDIIEDHLKIVVALSGYPKSKMRLKQMERFQRTLNDVIDMQLKAGLLKKTPSFVDYYLNRGAIVCICKDHESRDWMVRISPGMQERMCTNLILLKAKVKRLCLAVIKIPKSCWPANAYDAFKLLQYFNPTLRTHMWKIYAQKMVDDVEITSFLVDRVSGEIIRGPNFKNVIDYNQMEFELTGYTEIYYECFLSDMDEDLSSVASRVKLLEELRSNEITPRNKPEKCDDTNEQTKCNDLIPAKPNVGNSEETFKISKQMDDVIIEEKIDVKYLDDADTSNQNEDECLGVNNDHVPADKCSKIYGECEEINEFVSEMEVSEANISTVAVSDRTESMIESNENLIHSRNSNFNIDSNRGIAYHRRTNYLHVESELKIAIVLEGYPQNKLEGTHIRRLKHLFKEYLHKDMKLQRFSDLIIPKFQDVYLSNGAVIYICDSLETKDYLNEILPKFINSTGLKLTFRNIKNLVRYTRIVMRLPKELSHLESRDILYQLKEKYPKIRPDGWKYYSDVAGKQKRQFGVDPESLDVIKSSDFDPVYEGEKISFRIIDRQKTDVNFEESTACNDDKIINVEIKKLKENILKSMYCFIDSEILNAPLTKIRSNHYSNLIADDLKLYVGPVNYPEIRIDETMFYSIKKTIENIVLENYNGNEFIPKLHDMYLFDGVIFIICKDMYSRVWIEDNIVTINSKLQSNLKATEFRGAVGIVSMIVKSNKNTDEVISILQKQNPRLRTKFWRQISMVKSNSTLDIVLQIDKLSAQIITGPDFNGRIGDNTVEFKLGHLRSLLKPKLSLEELSKIHAMKKYLNVVKQTILPGAEASSTTKGQLNESSVMPVPEARNEKESIEIISEDLKFKSGESNVFFYSQIENKSIERDSLKSFIINNNEQDYTKIILKVPTNILPDFNDGLDIIFDLLEDKNPGLNTELWKVKNRSQYNKGKFHILIDKQSASVIKGKQFDSTLGGEKLKFIF